MVSRVKKMEKHCLKMNIKDNFNHDFTLMANVSEFRNIMDVTDAYASEISGQKSSLKQLKREEVPISKFGVLMLLNRLTTLPGVDFLQSKTQRHLHLAPIRYQPIKRNGQKNSSENPW